MPHPLLKVTIAFEWSCVVFVLELLSISLVCVCLFLKKRKKKKGLTWDLEVLGAIKPLRSLVANYCLIVWHNLESTNTLFEAHTLYLMCYTLVGYKTGLKHNYTHVPTMSFFFFFLVEKLRDTFGTWKATYLLWVMITSAG